MDRIALLLNACLLVWGVMLLVGDAAAFCTPVTRTAVKNSNGRPSSLAVAFHQQQYHRHPFRTRGLSTALWAVEKKKQVLFQKNNNRASAKRDEKQNGRRQRRRDIPKRAVHLYMDYAGRLWNETNPEARRRIANTKAAAALRQVQHILRGDEYTQFADVDVQARAQLLDACDDLLTHMGNETLILTTRTPQEGLTTNQTDTAIAAAVVAVANQETTTSSTALVTTQEEQDEEETMSTEPKQKTKNRRSILFGATMGLCVAAWVFSGNYIFTGLFTLMTILGQLEYYRMVINTGVYPARRISVVGACTMFLTALFVPDYHQICLPLFGMWTMIWFLTMRRKPTTIPEIATTFTGMFYLGYVPSFWVRIRIFGASSEPTRLAPLAEPFLRFIQNKAEAKLPSFVPSAVHLPITSGAIFIFWTWLCLAFSDVGAYFVGKFHGKTKLSVISPAAGATSPNKTVEGVLGGCAVSAVLGVLGAWVQKWPWWPLTGAIHGTLLALLGLLGDLTASMLKRDAGLKDFGDLLPEHGGVMDRVDSFIWSAPYSWLVCTTVIPALRQWVR